MRRSRYAIASLLLVCAVALVAGCNPDGADTPRGAAMGWSRGILGRDYAAIARYGGSLLTRAQVDRQRASLGLPASPAGVSVVVVSEADGDGLSQVVVGFRHDAHEVAPNLGLGVWEADGRWRVGGPLLHPSPAQRAAVLRTVTGFLHALALKNHTAGQYLDGGATSQELKARRRAAFGDVGNNPLAGFRVLSVDVATPPIFNGYFATATVSFVQAGHPITKRIWLTGQMTEIPGAGPMVTDALAAR